VVSTALPAHCSVVLVDRLVEDVVVAAAADRVVAVAVVDGDGGDG
jgi:hypothetical protein